MCSYGSGVSINASGIICRGVCLADYLMLGNPKRGGSKPRGNAAWFPYYAGFSYKFAYNLLTSTGLAPESQILDSWNGSGTTTSAAVEAGFRARGFDLNPVMTVTARARLLSQGDKPSLRPIAMELVKIAEEEWQNVAIMGDPLCDWFQPESASFIRALDRAIVRLLVDGEYQFWAHRDYGLMSELAAFFYLVMFRAIRHLLGGQLTSNPTWIKRPALELRSAPSLGTVTQGFLGQLRQLLASVGEQSELFNNTQNRASLSVASSEHLPLDGESIDLVLTSPPYCTRIDYAVATQPELALLGHASDTEFDVLRRRLIGTSTVPKEAPPICGSWGQTCCTFLNQVATHPSKASSTYYLKSHLQYFAAISKSMSEVSRVLKPGGMCVLVVQDSYYKDVHNDLAKVFTEMGENASLGLARRVDFPHARTMAGINPAVRPYRQSYGATESVLCLRKIGEGAAN